MNTQAISEAARPRPRWRVARACYRAAVVALVAVNAWWFVRDLRPLPELRVVSQWVRERRFDDAEAALREHIRRSPHNGEATIMLASVRATRGDTLGAARLLHTVPFWWPNRRDMLLLEGQLDRAADRAREAEAAWTECARDDPLHPPPASSRVLAQAALELLQLYSLERRVSEAKDLVWRIREGTSAADGAALLRAWMDIALGARATEADAETLRRYNAADPRDWEARRALAVVEQSLGHPDRALRLIDECVRARPNDLRARRDLLHILWRQGNTERLGAEVARLPRSAVTDADLWFYRGLASEGRGDLKAAASALRRSTELRADVPEPFARLSEIEQRLGQAEQAVADAKRAERLTLARGRAASALREYARAADSRTEAPRSRRKAIDDLVSACGELGWDREADAWSNAASEK